MRHDDGRLPDAGLGAADLVIVGPSRCGKTPLAMFLAQVGAGEGEARPLPPSSERSRPAPTRRAARRSAACASRTRRGRG